MLEYHVTFYVDLKWPYTGTWSEILFKCVPGNMNMTEYNGEHFIKMFVLCCFYHRRQPADPLQ